MTTQPPADDAVFPHATYPDLIFGLMLPTPGVESVHHDRWTEGESGRFLAVGLSRPHVGGIEFVVPRSNLESLNSVVVHLGWHIPIWNYVSFPIRYAGSSICQAPGGEWFAVRHASPKPHVCGRDTDQ